MHPLLFCCVGNAFLSPFIAALYNAEAVARGNPSVAMSAGLSNRREMPPTTPFVLAAIAQEIPDRPAVLEALRVHQPRPLKDLPFVAVEGVSYLYDPARKRDHLAQDMKGIEAWLRPAPGTPVMQLAIKDSGYQAWEQNGRPTLESAAGQLVLAAYRRDVVAMRALVNTLLAASALQPPTSAAPAPTPASPPAPAPAAAPAPLPSASPSNEPSPSAAAPAIEPQVPPAKKVRKKAPVEPLDPQAAERAEVLFDVRAWLRAALPTGRAALSRYGLWQRAQTHFGSWNDAVAAAGIPIADEPLWQLPARDPDLSFDILVESLPNAVVARLCSVTVAKVARRRRDTGAPDPARQLYRRIVATNQLGTSSDETIAAQLGITTEEVANVRQAEALEDAT